MRVSINSWLRDKETIVVKRFPISPSFCYRVGDTIDTCMSLSASGNSGSIKRHSRIKGVNDWSMSCRYYLQYQERSVIVKWQSRFSIPDDFIDLDDQFSSKLFLYLFKTTRRSWRGHFLWLSSCMSIIRHHKARLPELSSSPYQLQRFFFDFSTKLIIYKLMNLKINTIFMYIILYYK